MTAFSFGDILLLPCPFTDQTGTKKRPGVVVSSNAPALSSNPTPGILPQRIVAKMSEPEYGFVALLHLFPQTMDRRRPPSFRRPMKSDRSSQKSDRRSPKSDRWKLPPAR
jgi:hypothetical protein